MPSQPLPGPEGLYNVSVMPVFRLDSARVGWSGVYFTDIDAADQGSVGHVHQRLCLHRTFNNEWLRTGARTPWQTSEPGFRVVPTGVEERYDWRGGGRAQFLFVDAAFVRQVLGHAPRGLARLGRLDTPRGRLACLLFDALVADLAQGSPAGPVVGESVIAGLLAHLDGPDPAARQTLARPGRRNVLELIDAQFAQPLTLQQLADAAGTSVRQFTRAFRAEHGVSPHQYILGRRIAHARQLIRQGLPLADVAAQCGFADQSQFTRTFARLTGSTPGRFRAG